MSLDDAGIFRLLDVSVNRTVIEYEDKEVLKPLYLLMRSEEPALWKIHQSKYVFFLVTSGNFRVLLNLNFVTQNFF